MNQASEEQPPTLDYAGVKGRLKPPPRTALGEELPIFCEKCGYSLFGLPQSRCENCTILQFHCPECGHHQPINTLRPAAQTILGRLRGTWLALVVFVKLNFFVWTLFGWAGMGHEWSYQYDWTAYQQQQLLWQQRATTNPAAPPPVWTPVLKTVEMGWDAFFGWGIFGLAWGGIGRMLLLRWRHGYKVGSVLMLVMLTAVFIGVAIRHAEGGRGGEELAWPLYRAFLSMVGWGLFCVLAGAIISWPIWMMLVKAFLPKRTGDSLLDWQRSLSISVAALARDKQDLINSSNGERAVPSSSQV